MVRNVPPAAAGGSEGSGGLEGSGGPDGSGGPEGLGGGESARKSSDTGAADTESASAAVKRRI